MLGQSRLLSDLPASSGRCHSAFCPHRHIQLNKRSPPRQPLLVRAQADDSSNGEQDKKVAASSQEAGKEKSSAARSQRNRKGKNRNKKPQDATLNADDFNPIALGRRSR